MVWERYGHKSPTSMFRASVSQLLPCAHAHSDGTGIEASVLMANARRSWWTWNLGKIAGIPIRMHLTLVLLLGWITLSYATAGASVRATGLGVVLVLAIFAIIVVHELAHALVARHYGVATRDIMLLPV